MDVMSLSRLQQVIESSALTAPDKEYWMGILESLDDDTATVILESLPQDETLGEELESLTRSIQRKRELLAAGDTAGFAAVIEGETKELAS